MWNNNLFTLFCLLTILLACDDECYIDDCEPRPEFGIFKIKVNYNNQNSFVPITIYRGQYEDQEIFLRDTLYGQEVVEYDLPVDQYYSATATYQKNNNVITALDGGRISVSKDRNDCSGYCYTVNDAGVNLKLKY